MCGKQTLKMSHLLFIFTFLLGATAQTSKYWVVYNYPKNMRISKQIKTEPISYSEPHRRVYESKPHRRRYYSPPTEAPKVGNLFDRLIFFGCSQMADLYRLAGLENMLKNQGDFTILSILNVAFERLPPETKLKLLTDNDFRLKILSYHTIPGRFPSAEFRDELQIPTMLMGRKVRINQLNGNLTSTLFTGVRGTAVAEEYDLTADNGLIHVMLGVLFPPEYDLLGFLASQRIFSRIHQAILLTGADQYLRNQTRSWTFLAPYDAAWAGAGNLGIGQLRDLVERSTLSTERTLYKSHLAPNQDVQTFGGETLNIEILPLSESTIIKTSQDTQVRFTFANIPVFNGVVHIVNGLLLP